MGKPTLFITINVYLPGKEYNTQVSVLAAIHFLYVWAEQKKINLEASFAAGKFLSMPQIEELSRDIRYDLRSFIENSQNFLFGFEKDVKPAPPQYRRHRRPKQLKTSTQFNKDNTTAVRFYYVWKYLDWLSSEAISRTSARGHANHAMRLAKQEMLNAIKQRIPTKEAADLRRGLTKEQREYFLKVIDPQSPLNPFKSEFTRTRNQLIGLLLLFLGARRAEILLIKLDDIDWNLGGDGATVDLKDHPADSTDTRRERPQFKTRERRLPLGRKLTMVLDQYTKLRKKLPGVTRHGYLLVARTGSPLSLSSLDDIFYTLSRLEGLSSDFSAHLLRYTWNDMFSELADRKIVAGEWTVKNEQQVRRYHQGWSDNSTMPDKYARRHIEEKARKLSLEMQSNHQNDLAVVDIFKLAQ